MSENRRDVLANLKTALEAVPGVTTVVRTYTPLDLPALYSESDLPLIELQEPDESDENEMTGRRAIAFLAVEAIVHFVDWDGTPDSTYETLMKNIRDAIGNDFNLNGKSVATWITGVTKIDGELPLYFYGLTFNCEYYLNQLST